MKKQQQQIDLRIVWYCVFILVLMVSGEITTKAEPIDPTGIWKSSKDAFLNFGETSSDNLSAILFLKSKGLFNLIGIKAPARENGTFYLNGIQSGYTVAIAGQFLECNNGMERLQVVLQISANTNCDFDVFSRTSIHIFTRAEEIEWLNLESRCPFGGSDNDDEDDDNDKESIVDTSPEEGCILSGFWINEYNSTMNLTVDDTGKITGVYQTAHERAEGTAGGGMTSFEGWEKDDSPFTIAMIWNRGTSVSSFMGIIRYLDDGTCVLWTDLVLLVAQDTCAAFWKSCLLTSYNQWKKPS